MWLQERLALGIHRRAQQLAGLLAQHQPGITKIQQLAGKRRFTARRRTCPHARSWPTVTIAASVAMILPLVPMRWIPVLDDLADRSSPRSRPGIAASTPDRFLPSRPPAVVRRDRKRSLKLQRGRKPLDMSMLFIPQAMEARYTQATITTMKIPPSGSRVAARAWRSLAKPRLQDW